MFRVITSMQRKRAQTGFRLMEILFYFGAIYQKYIVFIGDFIACRMRDRDIGPLRHNSLCVF